jgi:hypothetical protein
VLPKIFSDTKLTIAFEFVLSHFFCNPTWSISRCKCLLNVWDVIQVYFQMEVTRIPIPHGRSERVGGLWWNK